MVKLVVGDVLRSSVEKHPDKTAFIFKDKKLTYAQVNQRANRLANGLLSKGYKPGDHIAVLAFNCLEYFEILFALGKVGMVAVPINFRLVGPEITYTINHSNSRALIYEADFREELSGIRGDFEKIAPNDYMVFGGRGEDGDTDYEEFLASADMAEPEVDVEESQLWYIGYTSGTTGKPKGAMRSHRCNILLASSVIYLKDPGHTILLCMPLFHSNSIWFTMASVYFGHTTLLYPTGGFDPREILDIFQREKITFTSMVPTMYSLILSVPDKDSFDVSSIKVLLCSSAPLMTSTKEQILEFFSQAQLYEGYGSTETGAVTTLYPEDQYRKVRSCGVANPFVRIKLLDLNGNEVPVGEVGELYAINPSMFEGYYNQPEMDAKSFIGAYASVGDMAKMDEEGFYYIVDRKNDMIISGGENIYPTEIDDLLAKHPKVASVAVIGVPDEKWGEVVKAVVVPKPGEQPTQEEIIAFAKQNLAGYKCPKSVEFRQSLPVNPTGKILKRQIREEFWEGSEVKV